MSRKSAGLPVRGAAAAAGRVVLEDLVEQGEGFLVNRHHPLGAQLAERDFQRSPRARNSHKRRISLTGKVGTGLLLKSWSRSIVPEGEEEIHMLTRPTRSWMFVPGNKERFLTKAADSDADCVFLDLEDGVLPDSKEQARSMVADALRTSFRPQRYVRLNAASTGWFADDLAKVIPAAPDGVCLAKCETPGQIADLAARLDDLERHASLEVGSTRIVAAVESPAAVLAAASIARAHPRVAGLMLGAEDLALDIGLGTAREAEAAELLFARSMVVYAAAAAGAVSIDGVFPDLDDPTGMERDTLQARRLGFTAKSTFNPRQIGTINGVFSPRPDEIAYAQRVADAFRAAEERGEASVAVGGQLVDRPIVMRAQRLLDLVASGQVTS